MTYSSIKATKGKDFTPVPTGLHLAICYQVIALGNQKFKNSVTPRVWLGFELPEVTIETKEGKRPMTIGKEYALFIGGKSKLGDALKNWRGKPFTDAELEAFEVTGVAGKICQLQVSNKESDPSKTEINMVAGLINAQKQLLKEGKISDKPSNRVVVYNPDAHDDTMWELVPEFLKRKIKERITDEEANAAAPAQHSPKDDFDDDIPF